MGFGLKGSSLADSLLSRVCLQGEILPVFSVPLRGLKVKDRSDEKRAHSWLLQEFKYGDNYQFLLLDTSKESQVL